MKKNKLVFFILFIILIINFFGYIFINTFFIRAGYSSIVADHHKLKIIRKLVSEGRNDEVLEYVEILLDSNEVTLKQVLLDDEFSVDENLKSDITNVLSNTVHWDE